MQIPAELKYLGTCFYSGSDEGFTSGEEWIRTRVHEFLNDDKRRVVHVFLRDLLAGPSSDDELLNLWKALDSDYWIGPGPGIRKFFELMRDFCK